MKKTFVIKGNKGLSLVEVLIAFTVLTVGILAVIGVFPQIFESNANTWDNITVMNLAQEKMDELLSTREVISEVPAMDYPEELPDATTGYRKWWGSAFAGNPGEVQTVYVEVRWVKKGRVKTYTLVSAVCP